MAGPSYNRFLRARRRRAFFVNADLSPAKTRAALMATAAGSPTASSSRIADERVLVLDFGAQYAQLIARRVREQQRLLRDRPARHRRPSASRELHPRGIDPLRRAVERL